MVRKKLTSAGAGRRTPGERAAYASLADWLDRTGHNQTELLEMVKARGVSMTKGHLSNILRGARRCSIVRAVILSEITGVPVGKLIAWPKSKRDEPKAAKNETSGAVA